MKFGIAIISLLFSLGVSSAEIDRNLTVTNVAIESNKKGYFRVAEALSASCVHSVIYFDLESSSGAGYLSALLSAKMASKRLSLISYDIASGSNVCTVSTIEIE
ncbi:MAG: hypothetical protein MK185_10505 [Saccharospirillaceae bacterium]|nr:hypothetical protein [Saccharospirillaceae bacterium]